ncbi:MAG: hypothetical protein NVSMB25_14610 [Thermoleophilaceae bacterium]
MLAGLATTALTALALSGAPPAYAQGIDLTCQLSFSRLEPSTTNALLLDTHAVYWVVGYQGIPGTRMRITGEFPHSRYASFNAYDPEARPADALTDRGIVPAPGSVNPFLPGAPRNGSARSYTAFIEFGPRPADPAPNTLYTGRAADGSVNYAGSLWYRVYLPDHGRDQAGGVGLPRVSVESTLAPGSPLTPDACGHVQAPTANAVNQAIADSNGGPVPDLTGGGYPGRNPPRWTLYTTLSESIQDILLDNRQGDQLGPSRPALPHGGGFFSNRDIAYVYAPASRGFGDLIVIHARAPSFPDTRAPAPSMPAGKQLRYFSLCQYDPLSQRVVDCRSDDELAIDSRGDYTLVVSTPAARPRNARPECGVAWLAWGPQSQGLLIYRQMLAEPSLPQAIAGIPSRGEEQRVMGPYYPAAQYLATRAAFEARGCPAGGGRARRPARSGRSHRRRAHRRHRRHRRHSARPRLTG